MRVFGNIMINKQINFFQQKDLSYQENLSKINRAVTLTCARKNKQAEICEIKTVILDLAMDVEKMCFLAFRSVEMVAYVLGKLKLIHNIKLFIFGQNKTSPGMNKGSCNVC